MQKLKFFSKHHAILLLIVLLGLSLRLVFFSGMGISDSLTYSKTANDINNGKGIDPDSTLTLSTRLGLIYATATSYRIFGIDDFSSVLFVLATSLGSIILIYLFGELLFNKKTGLMAAFLFSIFPLDIVYSTRLISDLPSAFFMSLGVYVFLHAELKDHKNKLLYSLSGILIGIAYTIRESALLIALFFIAYIIWKRQIRKEYFFVPLGVLLVFAIEMLVFLSLTNDPLFRLHSSQKYLSGAFEVHDYFGRRSFQGLFHYPWLFLTNNLLSFFYIFTFISIFYSVVFRKKETYTLLLWFVPVLFYLSFGSASIKEYLPMLAVDRYTYLVTMPALLLLSFFLDENDRTIRKTIKPAVLAILLLSSMGAVYLRNDRNQLHGLRETYPILKEFSKPIFIDDRSLLALQYISGYDHKINLLSYDNLANARDSYVVVNRHMIRNVREANPSIQLPRETENAPKNWQLVREIGKSEKDKILIYYSP